MSLRHNTINLGQPSLAVKKFRIFSIPDLTTSMMCLIWIAALTAMFFDVSSAPINFPLFHLDQIPLQLTFIFDRLTLLMLTVVSLISLFVHQYARRYMKFDTSHHRFMLQLSMVTASVIFFICAGNLLTAFLGWQLIGCSLYFLLNHYHFESEANRSAKKKFIINRIGDLCFMAAVVLAYQSFGTSEYTELFSYAATHEMMTVVLLLLVAVMTKSAQFPFHIWLPDTMQTPTPVSALMHAGVINSGGYLLTRLAPVIMQHGLLMKAIFWVGFATMVVGALIMRKQPDIKKKLAYSTMSQMGYMVMQCGIGSFALAIYHLIVHGLYKGSQFLSAGSMDNRDKRAYRSLTGINDFVTQASLVMMMAVGGLTLCGVVTNPVYAIFMIALGAVTFKSIYRHVKYPKDMMIAFGGAVAAILAYHFVSEAVVGYVASISPDTVTVDVYQYLACLVVGACFVSQSHKPVSSIYQRHLSVETFYRSFILKPYRLLGDAFNRHAYVVYAALVAGVVLTTTGLVSNQYADLMMWSVIFVTVIASNRVIKPMLFLLLVTISHIGVLMVLLNTVPQLNMSVMAYYIITSLMVVVPLLIISGTQVSDNLVDKKSVTTNKLCANKLYFAILCMLLIGAPGSSMLINELGVINSFYQVSYLYVGLYAAYLLLLSISVLHALQYYVFNQSDYFAANTKLDVKYHVFYILAIAASFLNGIYPVIQLGA